MNKQRRMMLISILIVMISLISGCVIDNKNVEEDNKMSVVCTNYPTFDWVTEIIGEKKDNFEVTLLSKSGDLHSFQPSAKDIAKIHTCDLFIYVGGNSDKWAENIVAENNINSLRLFDLIESNLVKEHTDHNHQHEEEFDEHIWLSLRLAPKLIEGIFESVCELDVDNSEIYKKNTGEYLSKLEELDKKYEEAVRVSFDKTIIFADRFPFIYLTKDYGINALAAFPGCSADSDASFEVITKLSEKVDELEKQTILVLENSNQSVAETVIRSSKNQNIKIAVMNSLQAVGEEEIKQETNYLEIMTKNLDALYCALK